MAGIKVSGVQQAVRGLRKFQRELEAELFDGVLAAARPVATEIRNRTPKGPTGLSRKSIKVGKLKHRIGRNVAAYVRVDRRIAPHFHFNEYGTVKQPPRPSFRPVVDQVNAGTFEPVTAAGKRALAKFKP
jgi:HK97 gp10 family phage protein